MDYIINEAQKIMQKSAERLDESANWLADLGVKDTRELGSLYDFKSFNDANNNGKYIGYQVTGPNRPDNPNRYAKVTIIGTKGYVVVKPENYGTKTEWEVVKAGMIHK